MSGPQMLLGNSGFLCLRPMVSNIVLTCGAVQDEELKKLLMSWYYAGKRFLIWLGCRSHVPFTDRYRILYRAL